MLEDGGIQLQAHPPARTRLARISMLEDRVAIVTGAANGIGRATAILLAARGARLVLMDIDAEGLRTTTETIRAAGCTCLQVKTDLTSEKAVAEGFAAARDAYGPADILVNNVGQGAREKASSFAASGKASWDFLISICLRTTILCTHHVVADMQARKSGKIVNISSDSALMGAKASAAYAAAKGGVISFTRSLARELAADQINVNAIAPGYIKTRALELLPKHMSEKALGETPMGRFGEPEDVANAVLFFASHMSRYVTGQTLIVNGGRWMN